VLDLGVSYRSNRPVLEMIANRIPATLLLTASSLVVAVVVGSALGIVSARSRRTWVDALIGSIATLLYAMPVFWVGLILVLVFSVTLGWLPAFSMTALVPRHGIDKLIDLLRHLALPAITLALFQLVVYLRLARSSTLEVQHREFVRTAYAKGLTDVQVMRHHILRNAMLPSLTMVGLQVGQMIGGAVVVETVFAWPGIGRLAFDALAQRDYQVILGVFFVSSIIVVLANLATDLVSRLVDPRIGN
jgi:peptide/nickel transport system permease protein